jgi:hypothetical protein
MYRTTRRVKWMPPAMRQELQDAEDEGDPVPVDIRLHPWVAWLWPTSFRPPVVAAAPAVCHCVPGYDRDVS